MPAVRHRCCATAYHGRPVERRAALLTGYESGEPARCDAFAVGA
jgi:predicted metalloprotease